MGQDGRQTFFQVNKKLLNVTFPLCSCFIALKAEINGYLQNLGKDSITECRDTRHHIRN